MAEAEASRLEAIDQAEQKAVNELEGNNQSNESEPK